MMDTKKRYRLVSTGLIIMVILNILVLGSLWIMRPPLSKHHNVNPRPPIQRILNRRLDLSDQQQQQFKDLRKKYRTKIRAAMRRIRQNRQELYDVVGTPDSTRIDSLTTLIAAEHKKIETINVRHFRALRALFTPAQQQKFDRMLHRAIDFSSRGSGPSK